GVDVDVEHAPLELSDFLVGQHPRGSRPDRWPAGQGDEDRTGHARSAEVDVGGGAAAETGSRHLVGDGLVAVQREGGAPGRRRAHRRRLLRAVERGHELAAAVVTLLADDRVDDAVAAGLVRVAGGVATVASGGVAVVANLAGEVLDDAVPAREGFA